MADRTEVIESGVCHIVRLYDRQYYLLSKDEIKVDDHFMEVDKLYDFALDSYGEEFINKARSINNSENQRIRRLRSRIEKYISIGQCLFVTLTFNDDILDSTSFETRRKYVQKFLKSISTHYVANVDYGSRNEREHYHAVVLCDQADLRWWRENCGFYFVERIKPVSTSSRKLAKYVSKLCNHAIKETTKRQTYIYSRECGTKDL